MTDHNDYNNPPPLVQLYSPQSTLTLSAAAAAHDVDTAAHATPGANVPYRSDDIEMGSVVDVDDVLFEYDKNKDNDDVIDCDDDVVDVAHGRSPPKALPPSLSHRQRMHTMEAFFRSVDIEGGESREDNSDDGEDAGSKRGHFCGLADAKSYLMFKTLGFYPRNQYNVLHRPLGIIGRTSRLRVVLITLVDHPYFEWATLFLILCNSITLGMDIPETQHLDRLQQFLNVSEIFFMAAFTIEVVLKISAMGFVTCTDAYLRSGWNLMDFFVVCCGYLNFIPGVANVTVLRMMRLLRPLRTMGRVDGLRILTSSLINALPALRDVAVLLVFFIFLFAIMGKELWNGMLHQRCYGTILREGEVVSNVTHYSNGTNITTLTQMPSYLEHILLQNITTLCTRWTSWNGNGIQCGVEHNGINMNQTCDVNRAVWKNEMHFDNIYFAMLQVFILVNGDAWPDRMKAAMEVDNYWVWLYFVLVVVIGGLVCRQIFLAVLKESYTVEWQRRRAIRRRQMERRRSNVSSHGAKNVPITPSTLHFSVLCMPLCVYLGAQKYEKPKQLSSCGDENELSTRTDEFPPTEIDAATSVVDVSEAIASVAGSREGDRRRYTNNHDNSNIILQNYDGNWENFRFGDREAAADVVSLGTSDSSEGSGMTVTSEERREMSALRRKVLALVEHRYFGRIFLFVALYNVTVISMDHYTIKDGLRAFIEQSNFVCNIIFCVEFVTKLFALGPRRYIKDGFNILDGVLVLVSIPDLILTGTSTFTVLRALRVLRVVVLMRRVKTLHQVIRSVFLSIRSAAYLCMFMVLFIYIMTILGLQLFSHLSVPDDQRLTFKTFKDAVLTVFVIVTQEDWSMVMTTYVEASGQYVVALYFVFVSFVSEVVLVNTFIAILIDAFQRAHDEIIAMPMPSVESTLRRASYAFAGVAGTTLFDRLSPFPLAVPVCREKTKPWMLATQTLSSPMASRKSEDASSCRFPPGEDSTISKEDRQNFARFLTSVGQSVDVNDEEYAMVSRAHTDKIYPKCFLLSEFVTWMVSAKVAITRNHAVAILRGMQQGNRKYLLDIKGTSKIGGDNNSIWTVHPRYSRRFVPTSILYGHSLGLISPQNKIRVALAHYVAHPRFGQLVLAIILISTVMLALDDTHVDSRPPLELILSVTNYFFAFFFVVEMVAKIIVYGLVLYDPVPTSHRTTLNLHHVFRPYLRTSLNRIDAFVALTSIIGLFYTPFRIFRCLRSLRVAVRSARVRVVLSALFGSIPAMLNVILLLLFLVLLFAVLGTQLMMGMMHACTDPDIDSRELCVGNYTAVVGTDIFGDPMYQADVPREWVQQSQFHYDDTFRSMFSLFVVFVGDGWYGEMFRSMDVVGSNRAPRKNARPENMIFFLVFIMMGTMYTGNLFVSVLVQKFDEARRRHDGSALLTAEQNECIRGLRLMRKIKLYSLPQPPTNMFRRWCFNLCEYTTFELKQRLGGAKRRETRKALERMAALLRDWGCVRHKQLERPRFVLEVFVDFCAVLNIAMMASEYYGEPKEHVTAANNFSLACLIIYGLEAGIKLMGLGVRQYFVSKWNRFDFFIFVLSVLGRVFGNDAVQILRALRVVRLLRVLKQLRGVMRIIQTLYLNIPSFINVSLLLVLIFYNFSVMGMFLCGGVQRHEGITDYMNFDDFIHSVVTLFTIGTKESWVGVMNGCAYSKPGVEVFFVCYIIFGGFVAINLFTAVVVDVFTEPPISPQTALFYQQMKVLRRIWLRKDPTASGRVHASAFIEMLRDLKPPMGFQRRAFFSEVGKLKDLGLRIDADCTVSYNDVVYALAHHILKVNKDEINLIQRFVRCPRLDNNSFKLYHWYVANFVQKRWHYMRHMKAKQEQLARSVGRRASIILPTTTM
eukprot:PhM_4_TR9136/c0_g1_i2/m.34611